MEIPKDAKPEVDTSNKRAGYLLAGGLTSLIAVLTTLGITTDELPNVWRNHQCLSYVAVSCVLLSAALGAVAGWILTPKSSHERAVLIAGNAFLAAGLIVAAWAGIMTFSDRANPVIVATPIQEGGKTALKVKVTNSHLKVTENLKVTVRPVSRVRLKGEDKYISRRALYSETLGAEDDGKFEHSFEVEIPPGEFEEVRVVASVDAPGECNEEKSSTSCVLVRLPNRREKPQLSFKWRRGRKGGMALRVHVTAADIPNRALQLYARALKPKRALLAEARIRPTKHGDVDRTFVLPVGRSRIVCVAAFTGKLHLTCPPKVGGQPVWARLRVPGSN